MRRRRRRMMLARSNRVLALPSPHHLYCCPSNPLPCPAPSPSHSTFSVLFSSSPRLPPHSPTMAPLPLFLLLLLFASSASFFPPLLPALPICLNQEAPLPLNGSLAFCSTFLQNDSSCCDASTDDQLRLQFQSFNVSDTGCATYLKQILCAKCDPYAGDLFQIQLQADRTTPVLCNATLTSNTTTEGYCQKVWNACNSIPIKYSPFSISLQGATGGSQSSQNATIIKDVWQSEANFCITLGGTPDPGEFCYSGEKFVPFDANSSLPNIEGICFDKIGNGVYLNMIPHPDGSNRVFLSTQDGKIFLATIPQRGNLSINASPFLDISSRVDGKGEFGLMGLAFHPDFKDNGRFFVSYTCDKTEWADCSGRCACNEETGCLPASLGSDAGSVPCQYSSVIGEYSANTSSGSSPFQAVNANPNEVRRIFTMGLPYYTHHGGQILFGPADTYMYFMMGDGGSSGDPFNFAQNKKSLLGKILRFDVDRMPDSSEITDLELWGNYSIPADNPFVQDNASRPEVWALGFRNPWRCSFDKADPLYFYCADVGQEKYEEVDLITKGGNYGWRVYEGNELYIPSQSPGGNTSVNSIHPIFPILGYAHDGVNPQQNSASITGGYASRSTKDPCLYGRYVYGDLYGQAMWAGGEMPPKSGNFTNTRVNFSCSKNSTMACAKLPQSDEPNFVYLFSFGEDNANDIYALTYGGVYRIADPQECGFICNATFPADVLKPNVTYEPVVTPSPSPLPSSSPSYLRFSAFPFWVAHIIISVLIALHFGGPL